MVSEEAHKELQADQDYLRQEDHRNRELEPDNLQHKIAQEQFQQRPRKSEEAGKKMEEAGKKMEETLKKMEEERQEMEEKQKKTEEAIKEAQERRRKAEEALDKLRSQSARPVSPTNQGIFGSDSRLSIASSVFRDQLLTDIF
jgi:hypothetical protein